MGIISKTLVAILAYHFNSYVWHTYWQENGVYFIMLLDILLGLWWETGKWWSSYKYCIVASCCVVFPVVLTFVSPALCMYALYVNHLLHVLAFQPSSGMHIHCWLQCLQLLYFVLSV
jgi:hypothetical protein